ncbi:MAG: MarR family winged helix-turn-helix transcriptional regulator [Spongiibacteraceae bacterium]|jgi:DNA-binding MarR family transcriptional regulator|nr:MarR family winged helix-turn-helix transcriptional regulator [Spongiibacteraceae bacterium]
MATRKTTPAVACQNSGQPVSYLESSPSFLVTAAANRLTQRTNRILRATLGVSQPDWRVLALLAVEPGATPARIGAISGVDKSVVSRTIASLQRRGLVRVATDPDHARRTRLFLTPAGQLLHDCGVEMTQAGDEQLLSGFSDHERAQFTDFMKRLTGNIALLAAPAQSEAAVSAPQKK